MWLYVQDLEILTLSIRAEQAVPLARLSNEARGGSRIQARFWVDALHAVGERLERAVSALGTPSGHPEFALGRALGLARLGRARGEDVSEWLDAARRHLGYLTQP